MALRNSWAMRQWRALSVTSSEKPGPAPMLASLRLIQKQSKVFEALLGAQFPCPPASTKAPTSKQHASNTNPRRGTHGLRRGAPGAHFCWMAGPRNTPSGITRRPRPTAILRCPVEPTSCLRTAVLRKNSLTVPGRSRGRPPSDGTILKAFRRFEGRQVGLLLTYGHGTTPAAGARIAGDINRLLPKEMPDTVSKRTILEDFFNSAGSVGTVSFDVYLLASDCG